MFKNTIFASSLALAGTALAISTATPANALTFNWSFTTNASSTGGAGQTISGTISGLVEGSNPAAGLTVTVDSTPTGQLTGGGWADASGGSFQVTNGVITNFDAFYLRNGGNDGLDFGTFNGSLRPLLTNQAGNVALWEGASATTFTPVGSAATPEPGSVVALLGLGALSLAGRKLRK